ncbi:Uncharacterised protein [Chlamydia trachomatis]|nr:Uncharacterised protein [Chlamydia trachomatis]
MPAPDGPVNALILSERLYFKFSMLSGTNFDINIEVYPIFLYKFSIFFAQSCDKSNLFIHMIGILLLFSAIAIILSNRIKFISGFFIATTKTN